MHKINERWVEYNANPNGKLVGDCPKRAISLAYDMPYQDTAKLLRSRGSWTDLRTIQKVISQLGYSYSGTSSNLVGTVEEFCNSHQDGCYLVVCGNTYNRPNHIVCCINGDWYDSWNSQKHIVSVWWKIPQKSSLIKRTEEENIALGKYAVSYISDEIKKICDDFDNKLCIVLNYPYNKLTGDPIIGETWVKINLKISEGFNNTRTEEEIIIPLSPKATVKSLKDTIKEVIDKRLKSVDKYLRTAKELGASLSTDEDEGEFLDKSFQSAYKPRNKREESIYQKLPMWSRKYVSWLWLGNSPYTKYTIELPPRLNNLDNSKKIILKSDTVDGIINLLNIYRNGEKPQNTILSKKSDDFVFWRE